MVLQPVSDKDIGYMPANSPQRKKQNSSPTIRDIAREVGVGKTTVSQVLSHTGNISLATRRAVLRTAKRMGYIPNRHAQRLSSGIRSDTIGLFVPVLWAGVITHRVELIQEALTHRGFDVPVYTYGSVSATSDRHLAVMRALCRETPRAIVCSVGSLPSEKLADLRQYIARGGCVVNYGPAATLDCDQVLFDYAGGAYAAVKHLLELGHRRLGLHCPNFDIASDKPGFVRALEEARIPLDKVQIVQGPIFEEGGAFFAGEFLRRAARPTAVCLTADVAASSFVNHVMRVGVRVPEDVSVIAFDDTPAAPNAIVPLTVIRHPVETIAEKVVEVLMDRLEGRYTGNARQIVIKGDLILRESTAQVNAKKR